MLSNIFLTGYVNWFPDTSVNQHVTHNLANLMWSKPYLGNDQLHVGDGKGILISNSGHTKLHIPQYLHFV
jgi:histone deacetylase 1/2